MYSTIRRFLGSHHHRRAVVTGLLAAGTLGLGASPALATTPVNLSSFPHVSSEDVIQMSYSNYAVPSDQIQVCLETGTAITWRKGIEWDGRRRQTNWYGGTDFNFVRVAQMYFEAERQRACRTQPLTDAFNTTYYTTSDANRSGRIIFGKAKWFGVYTQMYELRFDRSSAVGGRSYTFRWVEDNGPQ